MELYKQINPALEKTAMLTKLSENVDDWASEITNEVYNQLPFLGGKELMVDLQKVNEETKSALGVVRVEGNDKLYFPVIVKQAQLYPLDVMVAEDQIIPAVKTEADKHFFEPSLFKRLTPIEISKMNANLPATLFPFSLPSEMVSDGLHPQYKMASLVTQDHYDQVVTDITSDTFKNKWLSGALTRFTRIPFNKVAETTAIPKNVDAMVLYDHGDTTSGLGITIKPFELHVYTNSQLEKLASDGLFNDDQVVMIGPGTGLTIPEDIDLVTGRVKLGSGEEGTIIGEIVDLNGEARKEGVFVGKDNYGYIRDKLAGVQINKEVSIDNPVSAGKGMFYFVQDDKIKGTYPLEITGKENGGLVGTSFIGEPIKIAFSKNIVSPRQVSEGTYLLPEKAKFIKLPDNLEEIPIMTVQELNLGDEVTLDSLGGNEFNIYGPVIGEIDLSEAPEKVAQTVLLGLGATPHQVDSMIKTAGMMGKATAYTKKRLVPHDTHREKVAEDTVEAVLLKIAERCRPSIDNLDMVAYIYRGIKSDTKSQELIKSAGVEAPEDLLDNLLSLNFINRDNLIVFVEQLPELKKTASTLAGMLLATRLGLTSVPDKAVEGSIRNLTQVIKSLSVLREGVHYQGED
jgi:hypothetical protein